MEECSETSAGARIRTQCMYPSFDPVYVYVIRYGDGFVVHDGGDTCSAAWANGRDGRVVTTTLRNTANRFSIKYADGMFSAQIESLEWLRNAILAVSNAAALGAHDLVSRTAKFADADLKDHINEVLERNVQQKNIAREYAFVGNSGREYHFDFAVVEHHRKIALIDGVVPHAASIYAKFTAFSDVGEAHGTRRLVVYSRKLEEQDKTLLQQVADVVPFRSFEAGLQQTLKWHH